MPDPDQPHGDQPTGRPTRSGRRLGRILIPLGMLLVLVAVLTYIIVVAQTGTEDDSTIYEQESGSAPVSLLLAAPRVALTLS